MMRSLRRNLMLWIGVCAIAMFVLAGAAVYLLARASLLAEFDATTHAKARAVASIVEIKNGQIRVDELQEGTLPEFERANKPEYYQIWTDSGQTLAKSKSLGDGQLARQPVGGDNEPITEFVQLPDARRGRQICFRFMVAVEEDEPLGKRQHAVIALARETNQLDHMLARLGVLLVVVSGVATAVMLGLTALIIRRGLSPVDRLAGQITQMDARSLSLRMSQENVPAELSPIVLGLNGLLGRLESAFEREKSFTADAAHELRTPLAGLESALEVCARKERAPEAYAGVIGECLEVVRGMHNMIDNLLLLARADADQVQSSNSPVDLDGLLEQGWRRFSRSAAQRNLQINWDIPPDLAVQTDREKLLHVVSNVFENAVRYADTGGTIRVSASRDNGSAVIRVANSGSKIAAEDVPRAFERFWRGDVARSEIGIHCGLGLSVCRNMMTILHGSIGATSQAGGEFVVEIKLPATTLHPDFMLAV